MKYIVWDLISPHDGYGTTDCASWDDVLICIEKEIALRGKQAVTLHKNWLAGKSIGIAGKDIEIFVTSEVINKPIVGQS
jgi:hypothetical protein